MNLWFQSNWNLLVTFRSLSPYHFLLKQLSHALFSLEYLPLLIFFDTQIFSRLWIFLSFLHRLWSFLDFRDPQFLVFHRHFCPHFLFSFLVQNSSVLFSSLLTTQFFTHLFLPFLNFEHFSEWLFFFSCLLLIILGQ